MKPKFSGFAAGLGCLLAMSGSAQEIFLQSAWLNGVASPAAAAALWAGGNESSGTSADSPNSGNGICLAESAIGQITPQVVGYPGAATDLANAAASARNAASPYRANNTPAAAWTVIFTGGFMTNASPSTGLMYAAGCATNYFPTQIAQADYALRARLEVNPADPDAARQLVLLVEDQMLPLEWSGNMAMAYAAKARIQGLTQNGTNSETLAIEAARGYFQAACDVLPQFLANPFNASLVEGLNPLLSAAVTNQVAQVLDDYLRDLAQYAEASLMDFQIRQLANFYDPSVQGSTPPQALLTDIDNTANEIQVRLLLASPFTNLPSCTAGAACQIRNRLHDLRRFHQSVLLGRITFASGASGDPNGDNALNYAEYTTTFVPFFGAQYSPGQGAFISGNSSFDVALSLAYTFATNAIAQESAAADDVEAVWQRRYDWATQQQNLQNQYLLQLQNLCGYIVDTNNKTFPDIFTAALPPPTRDPLTTQLATNGLRFNETGTIYQQWQSVQIAQTSLLLASVQLSNILATMVEKTRVAKAMYISEFRLGFSMLADGSQIAALDVQVGEVQAEAALDIARINAAEAENNADSSVWSAIASGVVDILGVALAPETCGASLIVPLATTEISVATTLANAYDHASAIMQIGDVQANVDRRVADLNAQIDRIKASEQAQAAFLEADKILFDLSADLASLLGQAREQAIAIQLAAQHLDQERSRLANMLAQAGALLGQWQRSAALVSQNPQFSADLLLTRDAAVQHADDAFVLAQQWAFLAALCFDYKYFCPQDPTTYNFVQPVLAARNASALFQLVQQMQSDATLIALRCQNSIFFNAVQFSLRNTFVQANTAQGTGTNTVVTSYEPVLQGGVVRIDAEASRAAWLDYLTSCVAANTSGLPFLGLNFSTSLEAQTVGGIPRNPLFHCYTYDATLYSGPDNNGHNFYGVQVSVVAQGLSLPDPSAGITVGLSQNGVSAIRTRGYGNPAGSAPAFRYFDFSYYGTAVTALVSDLSAANPGTAAFQDRSPANTQWQLSIVADNANNATLLNNLDKLTDIQIQFGIRSYVDPTAMQNCTHGP